MTDAPSGQRLIGSFDVGAYGPTIFMMLTSRESVLWLRDLFLDMVGSYRFRDLISEPGVDIRGVEHLELRRSSIDPQKHLIHEDAHSFVWSADDDVWRRNAELLTPFRDGHLGHQYLTSEGVDDALVEISFGERDVSPWGRS